MANSVSSDVEALRAEIERLTRELDQASSEKIQSAQYGLVLLEEKGALQHKCEDLETLYENTKHELDITQEVGEVTGHRAAGDLSEHLLSHHRVPPELEAPCVIGAIS